MQLYSLHTCQCTFKCNHCFVWVTPRQQDTLSMNRIHRVLSQACEIGKIRKKYS